MVPPEEATEDNLSSTDVSLAGSPLGSPRSSLKEVRIYDSSALHPAAAATMLLPRLRSFSLPLSHRCLPRNDKGPALLAIAACQSVCRDILSCRRQTAALMPQCTVPHIQGGVLPDFKCEKPHDVTSSWYYQMSYLLWIHTCTHSHILHCL